MEADTTDGTDGTDDLRRQSGEVGPEGGDGCKPDSVRAGVSRPWTVIYLSDEDPEAVGGCPRAHRPGRRPVPPVLSCTAWGLSCPLAYAWGGGLLPRHFTLAPVGRYIFCDTFRRGGLATAAPLFSQGMLPCGVRTFLFSWPLRVTEATVRHRGYCGTFLSRGKPFRDSVTTFSVLLDMVRRSPHSEWSDL